jgi:hypothetical protein
MIVRNINIITLCDPTLERIIEVLKRNRRVIVIECSLQTGFNSTYEYRLLNSSIVECRRYYRTDVNLEQLAIADSSETNVAEYRKANYCRAVNVFQHL